MTREDAVTLGALARAVGGELEGDAGSLVFDVTHDSRQVREGWLFVAIRGEKSDGNRFVNEVSESGAAGVVSDQPRPSDFRGGWIRVPEARHALALAAAEVHGHPSRELKLVGITGTNGKTTTAYLVAAVVEAAGDARRRSSARSSTASRASAGRRCTRRPRRATCSAFCAARSRPAAASP